MAEYKYDEESVKELIEWAKTASFPAELELGESEYIEDVERYVEAGLCDIDAHYPDKFYNPAITRLYRLRDKLRE
jgi:hypothetical protein